MVYRCNVRREPERGSPLDRALNYSAACTRRAAKELTSATRGRSRTERSRIVYRPPPSSSRPRERAPYTARLMPSLSSTSDLVLQAKELGPSSSPGTLYHSIHYILARTLFFVLSRSQPSSSVPRARALLSRSSPGSLCILKVVSASRVYFG